MVCDDEVEVKDARHGAVVEARPPLPGIDGLQFDGRIRAPFDLGQERRPKDQCVGRLGTSMLPAYAEVAAACLQGHAVGIRATNQQRPLAALVRVLQDTTEHGAELPG
jgi:hypothetical protein